MKMFLEKSQSETVPEAVESVAEKKADYKDFVNKYYEKANCNSFPNGVTKETICSMLNYTVSGVINDSLETNTFDYDQLADLIADYISVMKKLVEK